ncbi:MAG: sulfatase-like hydrolase/transferase [Acidobacteriota bacterium]|nr:sulfatase-like hydrolase/transferase [Acidobacteriota bacterium]
MRKNLPWALFALYLTLAGSYWGLELDSFVGDLPFFRLGTLLLAADVFFVPLLPLFFYVLTASAPALPRRRALLAAVRGLNALYLLLVIFFAVYKSVRRQDFDFYFFWYNADDALPVIWKLFAPWIPVVLLAGAALFLVQKNGFEPVSRLFRRSPRKAWTAAAVALACCLACQAATLRSLRGSAAGFVYSNFLSDRTLRDDYRALYEKHVAALEEAPPRATARFDPSALGDAVFVVKQESLNGLLTGPRVTPQLLRAARDGILLPKMYGNTIQSLRGYGCILCGTPPSATLALADAYSAEDLGRLRCLPRIFQGLGYRTLYFFGGSRNPRIVRFAQAVGFEKVLADDIMRPGDAKFDWGYREDVFYRRVHEYLRAHCAGRKVFVFIDTGATNHTPFEVLDPALKDKVPFPDPKGFTENISNTTFVQDAYFGAFYDLFRRDYGGNGTVIAVSDHSWPIPVHKDNIYNERGAYEENFLISMVFVPPAAKAAKFDIGAEVAARFSQMDIQPTVLDLLGMERPALLGESFAPWLLAGAGGGRREPRRAKVSVQPYGGGFISLVRYPKKYLFDVLGQDVKVYDLEKDPKETSPATHGTDRDLPLLHGFFQK